MGLLQFLDKIYLLLIKKKNGSFSAESDCINTI